MNIIKSLVVLLIVSHSLVEQTDFLGSWEGAFIREGSVQLTEFYFEILGDSLVGYHNIPERELYREPLTDLTQKGDTLFFRSQYGPFWVIRDNNPDQLLGMSVLWNPKIRLQLKKSEPEEDYFSIQNFESSNGSVVLKGKVFEPVNRSPKNKLIVLIHGSGPVVMDDQYYRTEALALIKRGYHVAVYDKRGNGLSSGTMQSSTFFDFADDAISVLTTLKNQYGEELIFGFMGISQGGWVSAIASNKTNLHDFLILNVGPAVSLFQQEIDRVHFTLQQNGYDKEVINQAVEHVKLMFRLTEDSTLWNRYLESSKEIEKLNLSEIVNISTVRNDRHVSWWRANRYDPKEDLLKLKVPVLSLMGGADPLVPPETNKELMESLLKRSNAPFYDITILEGAYHNLQVFGTLKNGTWDWPTGYWVWQHKAEGLYETIDLFLERIKL